MVDTMQATCDRCRAPVTTTRVDGFEVVKVAAVGRSEWVAGNPVVLHARCVPPVGRYALLQPGPRCGSMDGTGVCVLEPHHGDPAHLFFQHELAPPAPLRISGSARPIRGIAAHPSQQPS